MGQREDLWVTGIYGVWGSMGQIYGESVGHRGHLWGTVRIYGAEERSIEPRDLWGARSYGAEGIYGAEEICGVAGGSMGQVGIYGAQGGSVGYRRDLWGRGKIYGAQKSMGQMDLWVLAGIYGAERSMGQRGHLWG